MKWPFGLLVCLLSACCPTATLEQATAFRGTVVGVSAGSLLHLERAPGTPLVTLTLPKAGVRAATGEALPLTALEPGDAVYVQGIVRDGELHAVVVQRLE